MSFESRNAAHRRDKNNMLMMCFGGLVIFGGIMGFYTGYLGAFAAGLQAIAH
jgi:hypothetical protein